MATLHELLSSGTPDMPAITAHLDGLDPQTRMAETLALGAREQARLYDAAAGHIQLGLGFLVPDGKGPLEEVPHHGKNSLPVFSRFAKVFCRPDGGDDDEQAARGAATTEEQAARGAATTEEKLWGYNRTSGLLSTTVGPGYFVAYEHSTPGELLVDYLRVPPRKPDAWPPILPNDARLSRFVYNGTQDVLRGVSAHVSIGRATKGGEDMDNWFVLCRES